MNQINFLLHHYRFLRYAQYRRNYLIAKEKERIRSLPRYKEGTFNILTNPLKFVDGASCHFIYQEVFEQDIYKFNTYNQNPYIIDAGANIGISVIYFKQLFPNANVVAFEPDKKVFKVLEENIKSFKLDDVILINKALWTGERTLSFFSEGADAGRISSQLDDENLTQVSTVRLVPYLMDRKVDFLKIDIEGAETIVLKDCKHLLKNVERIFVEYHSFKEQEQTLPELLNILKDSGFRLNINSPGLKSKSPLIQIETYSGMDMQLNIYGFRN